MISEPELEGELPAAVPAPRRGDGHGPGPVLGQGLDHEPETVDFEGSSLVGGVSLRRSPWVWGLAGVLLASAGWAGGLWAYNRAGPDFQGYGVSRNLCVDAELPALTSRIGAKRDPFAATDEDVTLDQAVCTVNLVPQRPWEPKGHRGPSVGAYAEITYSLHKKTDPGPQFDASLIHPADQGAGEQTLKLVNGVGERAYLVGRPGDDIPVLWVLDGQAVFSLTVGQVVTYDDDEDGKGDDGNGAGSGLDLDQQALLHFGRLEPVLVEDMLALMERLKNAR
ncbi:hypothetical protein OG875_09865 [Streptomyces sp. NBC_01498]|uniref:hypothetical protein n=1 Tax=Streptomyces sp. NBC_01498 TaxID=2975870 RepID=UPI002E7B5278|nr:hypothetical protein [Streptomyces sp. NBC_01498]WTL24881.1 hypothetical protein OG875_09865 [Streptomyces sp. NBC_01498]